MVKKIALVLALFSFALPAYGGRKRVHTSPTITTYYSTGSCNWTSASCWDESSGGSGPAASAPTLFTDTDVESPDDVTLDAAVQYTRDSTCTGTLTSNTSQRELIVAGTLLDWDACETDPSARWLKLSFANSTDWHHKQGSGADDMGNDAAIVNINGTSLTLMPVGDDTIVQDINTEQIQLGPNGFIGVDCALATSGCPANTGIEILQDAGGPIDCSEPDIIGTGSFNIAQIQHETSCNPGILNCSPTFTDLETYDVTGAGASPSWRFQDECDDRSPAFPVGNLSIEKKGILDFNGMDVNSTTSISSAARLTIGTHATSGGSPVGAALAGSVSNFPYIYFDPHTDLDQQAQLIFSTDCGPNPSGTCSSRIEATSPLVEVGTDRWVCLGGSDAGGCTDSGGDCCASLSRAIDAAESLGGLVDIKIERGMDIDETGAGDPFQIIDAVTELNIGAHGTGARPIIRIDDEDVLRYESKGSIYDLIITSGGQSDPDPPSSGAFVIRVPGDRTGVDSSVSCKDPCPALLDATPLDDGGLSDDEEATDVVYFWDFDDDSQGNWALGARAGSARPFPKGVDLGLNVGHLYRTGTYSPFVRTARTTGGTVSVSDPGSITVNDWPVDVCIWDGATPGTSPCPSGATGVDYNYPADLGALINSNCSAAGGDKKCALRKGDTYRQTTSWVPTENGNRKVLMSVGSGANPVVETTVSAAAYNGADGTHEVMLMGIRWEEVSSSYDVNGMFPDPLADGLTVIDVEFEFFNHGIEGDKSGVPSPLTTPIQDWIGAWQFIQEVSFLSGTGAGGNDLFMACNEGAFLGNIIADRTSDAGGGNPGAEHGNRSKFQYKCHMAHNRMGLFRDPGADPAPRYVGAGTGVQGSVQSVRATFALSLFSPPNNQPESVYRTGWTRYNWHVDNEIWRQFNNARTAGFEAKDAASCAGNHRRNVVWGMDIYTGLSSQSGTSLMYIFSGEDGIVANSLFRAGAAKADIHSVDQLRIQDRRTGGSCSASTYYPPRRHRLMNNTHFYDGAVQDEGGNCGTAVEIMSDSADIELWNSGLYDQAGNSCSPTFNNNGVSTLGMTSNVTTRGSNPFTSEPDELNGLGDAVWEPAVGTWDNDGVGGHLGWDAFGCARSATAPSIGFREKGGSSCYLE